MSTTIATVHDVRTIAGTRALLQPSSRRRDARAQSMRAALHRDPPRATAVQSTSTTRRIAIEDAASSRA